MHTVNEDEFEQHYRETDTPSWAQDDSDVDAERDAQQAEQDAEAEADADGHTGKAGRPACAQLAAELTVDSGEAMVIEMSDAPEHVKDILRTIFGSEFVDGPPKTEPVKEDAPYFSSDELFILSTALKIAGVMSAKSLAGQPNRLTNVLNSAEALDKKIIALGMAMDDNRSKGLFEAPF